MAEPATDTTAPPVVPATPEVQNGPPPIEAPEHWSAKQVPEDLRADPLWQRFKSPEDSYKAHLSAHKALGASLRIPKDDAPKEEWDGFYAKLGRPEKPGDYGLRAPEKLPDGIRWDDATVADFQAVAHGLGLNAKQAAALAEWDLQRQIRGRDGLVTEIAKGREKSMETLKAEWGPLYGRNRSLAGEGFRALTDGEERDSFDEKYGDDPVAIKVFSRVGQFLLEQGEITGEGSHAMSAEDAQKKLDEIKSARIKDPSHPMNNDKDPRHNAEREEYRRLIGIAQTAQPARRS